MTQLAASVDDVETLWTVDAVPDPEFGFYTVGSEIVEVTAGFPGSDPGYAVGQSFPSKIRVVRATNGTTAATHADGTALTAANAFSGGEVAVTVIRLGPAHITFEQLTLAEPVSTGLVVPAGAILIKAFAAITVNGDAPEGATVLLTLSSLGDLGTSKNIARYDLFDGYISPTAYVALEVGYLNSTDPSQVAANLSRSAIAKTDCVISVTGNSIDTDGILDVYALIAEPA